MKSGSHLILDFDTMVPEMKDYDTAEVPLKDLLFDREKLFSDFSKIVKPGDDIGNVCDPKFNLVINANMSDPDTDDEIIQMVLD